MPFKAFTADNIGMVTVYKRRHSRTIRLTVTPEGAVKVTIPTWTPYHAGLAFALSKQAWIKSQSLQAEPQILTNGQRVGKGYQLLFQADHQVSATRTQLYKYQIIIKHHPQLQQASETVQKAARIASLRALKKEATVLLGPRLSQLAASYGFTYASFTIKRMRTRWGSCDQDGNIVLNLYLMQLPWDCIDYVILHELTHTKVLNHGPKFWETLEGMLPEARKLRRTIKSYRPTLLSGQSAIGMA